MFDLTGTILESQILYYNIKIAKIQYDTHDIITIYNLTLDHNLITQQITIIKWPNVCVTIMGRIKQHDYHIRLEVDGLKVHPGSIGASKVSGCIQFNIEHQHYFYKLVEFSKTNTKISNFPQSIKNQNKNI